MPTIAITEIPFKMAQAKGFYREEGLEVEMIVIRGALGVTALIGGSVDYTTASGSIIAAAVRGIGVKLVLLINSKPAFDRKGAWVLAKKSLHSRFLILA